MGTVALVSCVWGRGIHARILQNVTPQMFLHNILVKLVTNLFNNFIFICIWCCFGYMSTNTIIVVATKSNIPIPIHKQCSKKWNKIKDKAYLLIKNAPFLRCIYDATVLSCCVVGCEQHSNGDKNCKCVVRDVYLMWPDWMRHGQGKLYGIIDQHFVSAGG